MSFTVTKETLRGRVRWRVRGTVEGERKSFGLYASRADAERMALALERKQAGSGRGLTLGAWLDAWLDRREASGQYRSARSMRSLYRRHVAGATLAGMTLRSVQPHHVARWLDGLAGARQTRRNALNLLRRGLAEARREGRINTNPATGLEVPRAVEADRWTVLTPREIADVLGCERIPLRHRQVYAVAIYAGLRAGELWGLRWERVHLSADPPHLEVAASYDGPPKTARGKRIVPLLPPALAALRELRGGRPRIGLVWPAKDGRCHRNGHDASWSTMRARAGIARRVRFHDLRHTCAASLVSGTWGRAWRIEEVRDWLGHSSVTVTERYARFRPDTIRELGREAVRGFAQRTPNGHRETVSRLPRKRAR